MYAIFGGSVSQIGIGTAVGAVGGRKWKFETWDGCSVVFGGYMQELKHVSKCRQVDAV